ncbi:MAG: rod shape-determining protein MreC [Clostridia bacterium]|nr:rod shape-determining protein MreC [Clostridia bacterium]
MSFLKKKPIYILLAVVLVAVLLSLISRFTGGFPAKIANAIITPVEKTFSKVLSPVYSFFGNVGDNEKLREENEALLKQVDELTKANKSVETYIEENARLSELLGLKEKMTVKSVGARVIGYDWDNFSETVTINRGKKDGVEIGNAVVTGRGVVGRVTEVGNDWAEVMTIISPEHSMGVRISRTGDLALCEGDVTLVRSKKMLLNYISGLSGITSGDILETSGEGGVYPPGYTVGRISEIKIGNTKTESYAEIEPAVDFSRISEVIVITGYETETIQSEYIIGEREDELPKEEIPEISEDEIENAEG